MKNKYILLISISFFIAFVTSLLMLPVEQELASMGFPELKDKVLVLECKGDVIICNEIAKEGIMAGIPDKGIQELLDIVECESGFNSSAIGDNGMSRGLWQIHKPSHPTITDEQAFSISWSTKWAVEKYKLNPYIWSCYEIIN